MITEGRGIIEGRKRIAPPQICLPQIFRFLEKTILISLLNNNITCAPFDGNNTWVSWYLRDGDKGPNPETKIEVIINYLDKIDLVLIMSVNPGFGGQKFMPEVLNKIKDLKKIQESKGIDFDIEIDGGINFDNSKEAIKAGANILVSGTTIFKSNNGVYDTGDDNVLMEK